MNKNVYQKIYYLNFFIYFLFLGYAFYDNLSKGYTQSIMMSFVSLALVFVVPLFFKIMKWKPIYEIYTLALIFIFLASLLGSSYRFYNSVPYWDKYVHCFSGVLGVLVAYILFCLLKKVKVVDKEDTSLMLVFLNVTNISIATLWELYEYAGLIFFDYDGIRHYKSGVHDAMSDILVCILGGLFTTYFIYRRYKTGNNNFFTNIYEKFYEVNKK